MVSAPARFGWAWVRPEIFTFPVISGHFRPSGAVGVRWGLEAAGLVTACGQSTSRCLSGWLDLGRGLVLAGVPDRYINNATGVCQELARGKCQEKRWGNAERAEEAQKGMPSPYALPRRERELYLRTERPCVSEQVAGHGVAGGYFLHLRVFDAAMVHDEGAAGMEVAACRRVQG